MRCGTCAHINDDDRRSCAKCGAALGSICPSCGFVSVAGVRYCGSCGVSIDESPAPAGLPRIPESFGGGRYRVKRMLGEGGSKIVYLARDTMLDRDVAFALIRTAGLDSAGRERVTREVRAMGRLGDHPNIVTVYDFGEEQGQPFMVAQYLEGGSVEELIARSPGRRLPLADAIRIAGDVCRALEHAHSLGVVHRDIKPANVWMGKNGIAKLGDFGLVIARDLARITASGVMVGTVAYMAPEMIRGGAVEPRSDLYSLGAMLYEMIVGCPPFRGDDLITIVTQHLNEPPKVPSADRAEVPKALDALVLELLAKAPERRPASAAAVEARLRAIGEGLGGAIDKVANSVAVERPNLTMHAASDGTVSILFSDIENSTAIYDRLGNVRGQELVRVHNSIIRTQLAAHHGREVKSMGDGFMIVFQSARRALDCAVAIQRAFAEYSRAHPQFPIRVRIGLHVGEAIKESGDFFGTAVIAAARVGSIAEGGEILVSSVFKGVVAGAGNVPFDAGREVTLKGLSGVHRVHRAMWRPAEGATERKCGSCGATIPARMSSCPRCTAPVMVRTAAAEPAEFEFERPAEIMLTRAQRSPIGRRAALGAIAVALAGVIAFGIVHEATNPKSAPDAHPPAAPSVLTPADQPKPEIAAPESVPLETHRKRRFFSRRAEKVPPESSAPAPPMSTTTDTPAEARPRGKYNIVVNNAMPRNDADEIATRLQGLGYNAFLVPVEKGGQTEWMVKVGPYQTASEANAAQAEMNQKYRSAYPPSQ